jgi:hypothetical protein
MDLPEAVRFALRLLMVAAEYDSATGGVNPERQLFATMRVLRGEGIEAINDEQQAEHLAS